MPPDGRRHNHRQRRARCGEAGHGGARWRLRGVDRFRRLTQNDGVGVNILRKGGKLVMVGLYGGANPISTVLFPFKMMTIEGSYVGTLEDLHELLALVQAGKVAPIPIERRPADQASAALSHLKSGGKVRGRVVLHH